MEFDNIMDAEVRVKVKEWLSLDQNQATKEEIINLVKSAKTEQLRKLLCYRMEFGTAGLRSAMGAGFSKMNDLTIIQTTQGLCEYMLESTPEVLKDGVIVGYDARHNSRRFAELTASILLHKNIPVYFFSDICPTPFVAYGVLKKRCSWGVMITASHNPKEDNGYKVYYSNGAQIISPHDKGISKKIEENLFPRASSWDVEILMSSKMVSDPYKEVFESYIQDLSKLCFHRELNSMSSLKFTYTAMHGVGYKFFLNAFQAFSFKHLIPVVEQVTPDPDFPTVKYPNPEEGKSALDYAIKTANKNECNIILANDPDADRLAVAEKKPDGDWHTFTGNETAALLGWWLVKCYKQQHQSSDVKPYCFASTVSSRILESICLAEGIGYEETLTGFKYMGNRSHFYLKEGHDVIFAFEEAIGFMCGSTVLDKDGISAGVVASEMANYLASEGLTLLQQLRKIYEQYGEHVSLNSYFICHDPIKIKEIFQRIRTLGDEQSYPSKCGAYRIKHIRDLATGYDSSMSDHRAILPVSKSSEMMTFTFVDPPCVVTLRTSGTEPKIKYYSEFCAPPCSGLTQSTIRNTLEKLVAVVIEEFLQPLSNGLISKEA